MQLKVKKLRPDVVMPTKAHDTDAGIDFHWNPTPTHYSIDNPEIKKFGDKSWIVLETGVSVEIPKGYCLVLMGRSGLAYHSGFSVMAGVIDEGFTGEIKAILDVPCGINNTGYQLSKTLYAGDKVVQGLLLPVPKVEIVEVTELSPSERGEKGYGSSDK